MNKYKDLLVQGYERVVRCDNTEVGFTAWAAVHDSTLGPALGGCRVWNYKSNEAALTDVLRLSRGMTYKNALARLELGGGKSVVRTDLRKVDRVALFEAFGTFIDYLDGLYITAEDVNSTLSDMEIVKTRTAHVATVGASGNPSPFTAYGVYCAIKASVSHRLQKQSLDGLTAAIQGVGETGGRLAELLAKDGCRIIAADINEKNIELLHQKNEFKRVDVEDIYGVDCDVFAPCALGGILNDRTIPQLKCSVVAGSANNQLLKEEDGEILRCRGILYAPDYAANAGGVINISCEIGQEYNEGEAMRKTALIGDCLAEIFVLADKKGLSTNRVANKLAEELIAIKRDEAIPLLKTA
jgi:leucine dehydrogenase